MDVVADFGLCFHDRRMLLLDSLLMAIDISSNFFEIEMLPETKLSIENHETLQV